MIIESLSFFRFFVALIVVIFHFGRDTGIVKIAPGFLTSEYELSSKFVFPIFKFSAYDDYFYLYLVTLLLSSAASFYLIERPIKNLVNFKK